MNYKTTSLLLGLGITLVMQSITGLPMLAAGCGILVFATTSVVLKTQGPPRK